MRWPCAVGGWHHLYHVRFFLINLFFLFLVVVRCLGQGPIRPGFRRTWARADVRPLWLRVLSGFGRFVFCRVFGGTPNFPTCFSSSGASVGRRGSISRRAVVCSSSGFWYSSFGGMLLTRSWALGKGPVRSV